MGYMRHHAILVTGTQPSIETARDAALQIFLPALKPTALTPVATNGYRSFLIPPDGSNEGWAESDSCDRKRELFVEWLRGAEDRVHVHWVEVSFGDEHGPSRILGEH